MSVLSRRDHIGSKHQEAQRLTCAALLIPLGEHRAGCGLARGGALQAASGLVVDAIPLGPMFWRWVAVVDRRSHVEHEAGAGRRDSPQLPRSSRRQTEAPARYPARLAWSTLRGRMEPLGAQRRPPNVAQKRPQPPGGSVHAGREKTCEAISLRRHCPDQVDGGRRLIPRLAGLSAFRLRRPSRRLLPIVHPLGRCRQGPRSLLHLDPWQRASVVVASSSGRSGYSSSSIRLAMGRSTFPSCAWDTRARRPCEGPGGRSSVGGAIAAQGQLVTRPKPRAVPRLAPRPAGSSQGDFEEHRRNSGL